MKRTQNTNRDILIKWLVRLDELLIAQDKDLTITIVGGSALIINDYLDRFTDDIDSISAIDKSITRELLKEGIDINSMCAIFHHTFYGWQNEVINVHLEVEFERLIVKTLSLEMILASKFFTRFEDRDVTDVGYTSQYIDKNKLERLVVGIWNHVVSLDKQKLIDRELEIYELYRSRRWDYENSDIKRLIEWKPKLVP